MKIYTTAPLEDPRDARTIYKKLEDIGYDGGFSFEAKHDPFLTLAVASEHTETLRLGTAIAIAFARNPMNLANLGYDMQSISGGRFVLGLGTQVRPHIEKRFSSTWSKPAARMREIVQAIRAIWDHWEGNSKLDFKGEFYTHSIMIPAFDPGPNPYGPPPIFTGGFGPLMTQVAGEVSDGFIAHPFSTRKSLLENSLPALRKGLEISGRSRDSLEVMCATLIVTADTEEQFEVSKLAARKQLAFYGSTPAYLPTLQCHGWEDVHKELNALSKLGRWDDMTGLINDEILEAIAVVGRRDEIATKLTERLSGIADSVSLTHNRCPDPGYWADIVQELRRIRST
ncbi:MAG: TIGR03617 family F420-dependent LLM class oxidoreductase [Pseudomonadales bacterium]|nr:TIGR03617 family F420-dependent LLM class oxidoreductase [Gammaproteobacteria bacterium]MBP6053694.1 TIGR03617 family F420-dependent LLM class oxidoreductase [Pseudomonadales bacterium]MBK6584302.1 TIGR03617 family F420-dependent LLM class oxidoreductase [Gammaproteobacteria bacterium]MBK7168454.1 TIGR03617 family F420-dependent LLM class oxidoreductase [Gammaproteobacteria bacterium]MBK8308926.1 TIGR03617 family F420-dependent LLM class oxidoreductase [Gammaproteobacteria bacterium]